MKIGYRREDIDFILDHYQDLQKGILPEPVYDDSEERSTSRHRALFEEACLCSGEIAARVKLCGQDGMLVEERYGMNNLPPMSEAQIEKSRHIDLYEVCRRINRVKWFCVGRTRKIGGYEAWKRRTRHSLHYRDK